MTFSRILAPLLVALTSTVAMAAAPAEDAVKAYRDYVAAIRAGSAADVLKLVEPVPASSRPLVAACVESLVAVEAVKTEMTKQMGPEPSDEEESWNMGQLPDRALKDLKGEPAADDTVRLKARDPLAKSEYEIGIMVRRDGKWMVPAATVIGLEPAAKFEEPAQDERARLLAQARAVAAGAKSVLERLRKKEFKTPPEVQTALTQAMVAAPRK